MIASRLERALIAHAGSLELRLTFGETTTRPWSSATFEGERVRVTVASKADPRFDAWLSALPQAELPMRGCYVADLAVRSTNDTEAVLEALVLLDA